MTNFKDRTLDYYNENADAGTLLTGIREGLFCQKRWIRIGAQGRIAQRDLPACFGRADEGRH